TVARSKAPCRSTTSDTRYLQPMTCSNARLKHAERESRGLRAFVHIRVVHIAWKRHRVAGTKPDVLFPDRDGDLAFTDLQQLVRARRVRLAHVSLTQPQSPVPQLEHVRRLGAGDQHAPTARLPAPEGRALAVA